MKYEYEDDGAGVDVYIIDTYVDIQKFITIYGYLIQHHFLYLFPSGIETSHPDFGGRAKWVRRSCLSEVAF